MAWIPLNAVKWIEFPSEVLQGGARPTEWLGHDAGRGDSPQQTDRGPTRKVAIRFFDGEVIRGHAAADVARHRFGFSLLLYPEEGAGQARRLGIPYSAIKAVFYVRQFDGRGEDERGLPSDSYLAQRTMAPLLDVIDEMEMLQRLHQGGVLSEEEFRAKRTAVLERM